MKATITQRFVTDDGIEYDVDCDCRFLFFCLRSPAHDNDWKVKYVKLVYEKDKVCPVDGKTVPDFNKEDLDKYPMGYKYLGVAQASLGYVIDPTLVTLEVYWDRLYTCMERWLDGDKNPGLFWDSDGIERRDSA